MSKQLKHQMFEMEAYVIRSEKRPDRPGVRLRVIVAQQREYLAQLRPAEERLIVGLQPPQYGASAGVDIAQEPLGRQMVEIGLVGEQQIIPLAFDQDVEGKERVDFVRPAGDDGSRCMESPAAVHVLDKSVEGQARRPPGLSSVSFSRVISQNARVRSVMLRKAGGRLFESWSGFQR